MAVPPVTPWPRVAIVLGAVVASTVLPACAATDGDPAMAEDAFRTVAIGLCGELIDAREPAVWQAGTEASLRVLELSVTRQEPALDEVEDLTAALTLYRDDLLLSVDALGGLEPPDDLIADWQTVIGSGANAVATVEARLAAVTERTVASSDLTAEFDDVEAVGSALEALALVNRDCASVFREFGPAEGFEDFVTRAAGACTLVVERRLTNGYDDDADAALDTFATVLDGAPVEATPELIETLERLATEWHTTHGQFAALDPEMSPAPTEWQRTIDYATQRATLFEARAAAVSSGDPAKIETAFTLDPSLEPGLGDLAALGLAGRDCRAIRA
ncbi:MAG TPA: hypothetical protein VNQ73_17990 [Ilumatobacter sp.]|nr:hypothetical protein [Ilumatobacter sp.]